MHLLPIAMTPAFRYGAMTPWGGTGLASLGKVLPDPRTGESLEVSALPGLESRDEQGYTLPELLARHGEAMRGTKVGETFPLLLKLIATDDALSVQVHPDDAYAMANEGGKLGKTEAWVILSAAPGAQIIYGIREGVTREALAAACQSGGAALQSCLNRVGVKPGDVYLIPAGMVHALGGGITLMELQQSSDVTYRFYDWDRVDANGRRRELHVKKGLDVVHTDLHLPACEGENTPCEGGSKTAYIRGDAFTLERWHVCGRMPLGRTPEHFRLLCALAPCSLVWNGGRLPLAAGQCVFLPAQLRETALEGHADALVSWPGK